MAIALWRAACGLVLIMRIRWTVAFARALGRAHKRQLMAAQRLVARLELRP